MSTEIITTHEIAVGDVIHQHGMVLLVDQQPRQTRHPVREDGSAPTLATDALILNWDELLAAAAGSDTVAFLVGLVRGQWTHNDRNGIAHDGKPRWTIQGNGWARWARCASGPLPRPAVQH